MSNTDLEIIRRLLKARMELKSDQQKNSEKRKELCEVYLETVENQMIDSVKRGGY